MSHNLFKYGLNYGYRNNVFLLDIIAPLVKLYCPKFAFVECDNGTYGYYCVHSCSGHCLNGSICNKQTGHCDMGCDPGYTDNDCNKRKYLCCLINVNNIYFSSFTQLQHL